MVECRVCKKEITRGKEIAMTAGDERWLLHRRCADGVRKEVVLQYARKVLEDEHPMTVRQIYYQLVGAAILENNVANYRFVSKVIAEARMDGEIPWEHVEDRLRKPHKVQMWDDLPDFSETVRRAYRRDVWRTQPQYVEVWLEKQALERIFEETLNKYGVTLNVGRGYDGMDSVHNAAQRYLDIAYPDEDFSGNNDPCLEENREEFEMFVENNEPRRQIKVNYYGDMDPSGEDMIRSLRERLASMGATTDFVTIRKCALTIDDINRYNLPPAIPKKTDSRHDAFVAKHGEVSVELDALKISVLRQNIIDNVEQQMDMDALSKVWAREKKEKEMLVEVLNQAAEKLGSFGNDDDDEEEE